jgi:hypothetical protein
VNVINAEQPASGTLSQQLALGRTDADAVQHASIQVVFAGAPGAFQIDILTSDTDLAADYVIIGTINNVNANNVNRTELSSIVAKFIALKTTAQNANAVNCTATITRG